MAVDVAELRAPARTRLSTRSLLRPATAVGALVAASSLIRIVAAHYHTTPRYYPDEYIYAELGRSLAEGELAIRGEAASFPALLEPLLQAPFWLLSDVGTSYHAIQAVHALAMSLSAVPIYLLAGIVGLAVWQRIACAVLTLALPAFVLSAYLTADALALPLALAALAAAGAALNEPTRRNQVLFLSFAGLATFARVQYVVLPAAFVLAAAVVSGGRPRVVLRRYRFTLVAMALPLVGAAAMGPARLLGYYDAVFALDVDVAAIGRWGALDLALLAFAAGWVLIPVALVGLVSALVRPLGRPERGFAALATFFLAGLLLEAGLYASNGSERFQERYLVAVLPLVPVLFFVGARRLHARRAQLGAMAIAAGLVVLAARLPLAGYTAAFGKQDSAFLQSVHRLEDAIGIGEAGLAVALTASALGGLAALLVRLPRRGTAATAVLAGLILGTSSAGAVAYDLRLTERVRSAAISTVPGAVDGAGLGPAAILLTTGADRASVFEQMFWNRSLDELLLLGDADEVDTFGAEHVSVGPDGSLSVGGDGLDTPLVVQEYAVAAELEGGRLVERTAHTTFWRPTGVLRLALLAEGRYFDGWLAPRSAITIWPRPDRSRAGTLRFTLASLPGRDVRIELAAPGFRRSVRIAAGERRAFAIPVEAARPWRLELRAQDSMGISRLRQAGARIDRPWLDEGSRSRSPLPIGAT